MWYFGASSLHLSNHSQQSSNANISLHDDAAQPLFDILRQLRDHPDKPLGEAITKHFKQKCWLTEAHFDEITETYIIADKYEMQTLQSACASTILPEFLARYYEMDDECLLRTVEDFKELFFDKMCERFGHFPEDLYNFFAFAIELYAPQEGNADVLLDAASECPNLALHINKALAKKICADRKAMTAVNDQLSALQTQLGQVLDPITRFSATDEKE